MQIAVVDSFSFDLLEGVESCAVSEQTLSGQHLIHELLVADEPVKVAVEPLVEQDQLALRRMEAIALHQPLKIILGKSALFENINACEGVVNVECWSSREPLLTHFNLFFTFKVGLEQKKVRLSSIVTEIVTFGNVLIVNVLELSVI